MKNDNDDMVSGGFDSKRTEQPVSSPLGRIQLFFILAFSSLVTLIGTCVHLTLEYRNDIGHIHEQLNQIEKGYLQSLTHSLWKLDDAQIDIELKNMLSLRDVVGLEITERGMSAYRAGEAPSDQNIIRRDYDMVYEHDGGLEKIGTLHAVASLSGTYHRLGQRILVVLVTQGIKTFLVSLFILFVIHFMVTRHLGIMAKYVRKIDPRNKAGRQLTLTRRSKRKDELDEVVRAINGMEKRLQDDIEKQKELESQLYQSRKMEAIGTLAGGIAHDFNNILTIIMGNAELAVQSLPSNMAGRRQVEEIVKASLRAKSIIAQLLKFSKKMDSTHIRINPTEILKEVHNLIHSSIPANITMEQHIENRIWTILADPTQIHQVILNLYTNAIHAMESKAGRLIMRLANTSLDDTHSDRNPGLSSGKYVLLEVSDTGMGISQENIPRIFDPYFTTKSIDEGTGMGLSVVQGIISDHKGAIDIESRLNHGTTVRVYLPADDSESPAVAAPEKQQSVKRSNAKVLLVDDERQVATLGKEMLEHLGYMVEVSTHPEEAMNMVREDPSRLDLLITDLSMPALSGVELADAIHEIRPDVPIILCSGFAMQIDPEAYEQAGISRVLEKPFSMDSLSKAVCEALS